MFSSKAVFEEAQFRWMVVAAVCVAGLLAYANTFPGEFVWDDASSILLHKHVQDPGKLGQLFREDQHAFGRGQGNFYRPLLAASFMLDYALSHKEGQTGGIPNVSPFIFHLSSLAWHVGAALLLFALLTRMGAPMFVRAATPLLYVLHPLHTEAVSYISGRGDSMAAFFMFAALCMALWETTGPKRALGAILSGIFFACGLLSKESVLIFPVLLVALLLAAPPQAADQGARLRYLKRLLPLGLAVAVAITYGVLRGTVLSFGSDSRPPSAGIADRLTDTAQAFALYIKLIFLPTGLHMERTLEGTPGFVAGVGVLLLAACVGLIIMGVAKKRYRVAVGMAWFLAAWLPISGLIPLNAPMAEHWLYVPLAGFIWALTELLWQSVGHTPLRHAACGLTCAACVCLMAMTITRNRDWHDNESLYRATLAQNPKSVRVHYNLAVAYEDILNNPAGARRHYEQVVALHEQAKGENEKKTFWDDELEAHLSLGNIYFDQHDITRAAQHYATVLSINETPAKSGLIGMAAYGMGRCLLAGGRVEDARGLFDKAQSLIPELAPGIAHTLGQAPPGGTS